MPDTLYLCVIPSERVDLVGAVQSAGGTPVVDLTCSARVRVPRGAWVRVRSRRSVPGTGPVLLAGGGHSAPVRGRETWLEVTEPVPVPEGFAGVVLRGQEAGGPCSVLPGLELLAQMPKGVDIILDAGLTPGDMLGKALGAGVRGVVLSDVLLALPEMRLPQGLRRRMEHAGPSSSHVVNGFRIQAGALAPVLRRLLAGAPFWDLAADWFASDDPANVAWPAGRALAAAPQLAGRYQSLDGLISAYRQNRVSSALPGRAATPGEAPPGTVAIIGLGCRLPGANSVEEFWSNILNSRSSITTVPTERWDPALYWDADHAAADKTYSCIGGFVTNFVFNPRRFRIPPNVAEQVDLVQQMTLESVADALEDAGYRASPRDKTGRDFDRNRTAVILGNSMGGEVTDDYTMRVRTPAMAKALSEVPEFAALPGADRARILAGFESGVKASLPPITEDSMPGELSNVIAGRVANAFDLTGPNFTVDAACASSMAAVQTAVKGLQDGDFDLVITGGADRSMGVATYTKFSKIGALSAEHSAPFDSSANGFVMGEGSGILLLKRLEDARRDGDRIYAVVRGIGGSSDGKGKGITAPNPRGQLLSLRRAYAAARVDPAAVDLVECHGTSTVVGDKVEVECLSEVIGEGRRGERGPVRIGSVKSNIGHLKSAAGAASLIKAALAVHQAVLPPSINFKTARTDVPFGRVPLQVQTRVEPWVSDGPRLAGVSAFGFGGTNFHVVLEEHAVARRPAAQVSAVAPAGQALPMGLWAVSAGSREELLDALEAGWDPARTFHPSSPVRIVAAADTEALRTEQIGRAIKVLKAGRDAALLRARSIYLEDEPNDGKVAFVFTGQGSQYLDMGLDLAARYEIVAATFAEADAVMAPELGRPLTDFIRRDPTIDADVQFEALRATEISQPATLTVDVAILRLLASFGVFPDMVAGHSLGEYSAAVAAGMLDFADALRAVSARGREMASVQIEDKGRMAGIAARYEIVQEVLAEIPGYVVAANKNCASQTVIAGESTAVEAAIEGFRSRGITVYPLPVSHAFHTRIVAPASEPLKRVLQRLDIRAPRRPITTNVDSRYYPTGPGAREKAIEILAKQVASPVEWIDQIERMYADGARVFVECGPKRALTGFVVSTLKRRPHRAVYTNHPKFGGLKSFHDALAALVSVGMPVRSRPAAGMPDLFESAAPRLATSAAVARRMSDVAGGTVDGATEASSFVQAQVLKLVSDLTGYGSAELTLDDELEADLGIDTVKQAELVAVVRDHFRIDHDAEFRISDYRTLRDLANYAADRLGSHRPASLPVTRGPSRPASMRTRPVAPVAPVAAPLSAPAVRPAPLLPAPIAPSVAVPSGGGLSSDALSAMVEGAVRAGLQQGDASAVARAVLPAFQSLVTALAAALPATVAPAQSAPSLGAVSRPARADVGVVASGAAVGLPGGEELFGPDNFDRILAGENRISRLGADVQDRFLEKTIVRLQKDARTGQGSFVPVETRDQVIKLAGVRGRFDLVADYGVDPQWVRALDITTQMAFAVGVEALRDAGIPLVRHYRVTRTGKKVPQGWVLPESLRDRTGIIFASAFPGYSKLIDHIRANGDDGEGRFDRRFLFQILAMGHSQFAQYIGARGPNTQINSACASTTQAIGMGQDWIQGGRADRVVIVGADDVTNDQMLEWIGAGFLAAGAATTEARVEDAALPFDRRRHGMILGMGAVGMVLEREGLPEERGLAPIAKLLATRMANSAFHGTRLDPAHIAGEMDALIDTATRAAGVSRAAFAGDAVFMSHETYTPAKGGSAAAEIESLRGAFGDAARDIVIANTKGFTGHAMAAGIEDAVVLKALQFGRIPPVPNLQQPDPDLGDLRLSSGSDGQRRFAVRLAAGFGSQLSLAAWESVGRGRDRLVDVARRDAWLTSVTGLASPTLEITDRTLRAVESAVAVLPARPSVVPGPAPAPVPVALRSPVAASVAPAEVASDPVSEGLTLATDASLVLDVLLRILSEKTGYGIDELDPEYELEADLGVDTVKQAEVFGEVREHFGLPLDEGMRLSDYPSIRSLAGYVAGQIDAGGATITAPTTPVEPVGDTVAGVARPSPALAAPSTDASGVLDVVLRILSEKTGYGVDELDPEFELEADLGVDTVKQAEVFGEVRDHFGLPLDEGMRLSDYLTIQSLAGYVAGQLDGGEVGSGDAPSAGPPPLADAPVAVRAAAPAVVPAPVAPPTESPASDAGQPDAFDVLDVLLRILSEKTGYGVDELDPEFELEADLGVDTVKQAEVFGEVRDHFGLPLDEGMRLSDYLTIQSLAVYVAGQLDRGAASTPVSAPPVAPVSAPPVAPAPAPAPAPVAVPALAAVPVPAAPISAPLPGPAAVAAPAPAPSAVPAPAAPPTELPVSDAGQPDAFDVLDVLLRILSEKTGYGVDELDPEYELEADLGVDTVKQAEVFGEVRDHFGLPLDEGMRLSDYLTIQSLAGYLAGRLAEVGDLDAPKAEAGSGEAPAEVPGASADVVAATDAWGTDAAAPADAWGADANPEATAVEEAPGAGSEPALDAWDAPSEPSAWAGEDDSAAAGEAPVEDPAASSADGAGGDTPARSVAFQYAGLPREIIMDGVEAQLLAVISAQTGYGEDELDVEYELEADLGIDTVKQAEIFAQVRDELGLPVDTQLHLSDAPTIEGLVRALVGVILGEGPEGGPGGASVPDWETAEADAVDAESAWEEGTGAGWGATSELEAAPAEVASDAQIGLLEPADAPDVVGISGAAAPAMDEPEPELESASGDVAYYRDSETGEVFIELPQASMSRVPSPTEAASGEAEDSPSPSSVTAGPEALPWDEAGPEPTPSEHISEQIGADAFEAGWFVEEAAAAMPRPAVARLGDVGAVGAPKVDTTSEPVESETVADTAWDTAGDAVPPRRRVGVDMEEPTGAEDGWTASEESWNPMPEPPAVVEDDDDWAVEGAEAWASDPSPEPLVKRSGGTTPATIRGLPESFRVRRPVVVTRPPRGGAGRLNGEVVRVLGQSQLALSLRLELLERGASFDGDPVVVFDAAEDVYTSFAAARELNATPPAHWVCGTRLGMDASWIDPERGGAEGARGGLAKALGREWPDCYARVVDVDPLVDDSLAARLMVDEYQVGEGAVEIFRDAATRKTLELKIEAFPERDGKLRKNSIVVLTGGTRGITARVALELARRGPVRLVLLARTAPGTEPLDEASAKTAIRAQLRDEGIKAVPRAIDERLRPLRSAEEARLNVEAMRALGAEVHFFPVDASDEDAVRDVMHEIRDRIGFIDGFVHGAGVERSRMLADKDMAQFREVFDGKARGGMAIARNLERIAWFVSMGSVAGRFGNAGQVDYSAANEAMARVCLARSRSLHVDWTAWADTGMAVRGGMERLLTERGVELLPADAGARLLVDLVTSGTRGEVMVAGALGDFTLPVLHSLVDRVDLDGDAVVVRRQLSIDSDPWIVDHSIGGVPVLPGVMGLELMAAAADYVRPGQPYQGARDVAFLAPLKLHGRGPVNLEVRAVALSETEVRCELLSSRKARTGRVLTTRHFESTVVVGDSEAVLDLPTMFFTDVPLTRDEVYKRFFHGPRFQVLEEVEAIAAEGAVADARVDHASVAFGLLSAPLVLESAFQVAGLHRMAVEGKMALPAAVDRVFLERAPRDGERLSVMVRQEGENYDIDVDGENGRVMRVRGFRLIETGPLPDGAMIDVPEGGWPKVVIARATRGGDGGAMRLLLDDERAEISARGTPRRQAERALGRVAARRAVSGLTGLEGAAFRVQSAPGGRPIVRGDADDVQISLSHRQGEAVAVACSAGVPGVDLERVELRHPAFARMWFTEAEQALWAGDPMRLTAVWAIKESVLKALGTGMRVHPAEIEVQELRRRRAKVVLFGDAARTLADLGGQLCVTWSLDGDRVIAAAMRSGPAEGEGALTGGAQLAVAARTVA